MSQLPPGGPYPPATPGFTSSGGASAPPGGRDGKKHKPRLIKKLVLLPNNDLVLDQPDGDDDLKYKLFEDVQVVLALPYGIGPNEPRLLAVDDGGKIILSTATNPLGQVRIQDGAGSGLLSITPAGGDGIGSGYTRAEVESVLRLFNNVDYDRARDASAANLIAQSGLGATLAAPPGMWSVVSTPAAGAQATATKAAGSSGVRHVCTGIIISFGAIAAPVATLLQWNLRDGATGAGTILASGQVAVPAAVNISDNIVLSGLCIPGTAATAMTLEFSALLANLAEGVTLIGFDAS